jgi:predicted DNA-binding antitoxin AbrB/MazE fold protein
MTVKAIYENGVFRPQGPVELEEHTVVEVLIPEKSASDAGDPTGWKADMAENHDHCLCASRRRDLKIPGRIMVTRVAT